VVQALRRYSEYLTPYEQSEILDQQQVFFVGRSGAPKIKGNPHLGKARAGKPGWSATTQQGIRQQQG
jgi:dual specificity tyrosine-phosphorylation-regulated kinase 2/3/4